MKSFKKIIHIHYWKRILSAIPGRYCGFDSQQLMIAHMAIFSLDVLGALDTVEDKQKIIDWIYSLQVVPNKKSTNLHRCGFRGGGSIGECDNEYNTSHVAMTYCAIASLLILGDDLSRVHKKACLEGIKVLQLSDGSFTETSADNGERDLRFVYCACCVCKMLDDFTYINVKKACIFIKNTFTYDGGFGQSSCNESHGGSTFCAIAALDILGKLDEVLNKKEQWRLKSWCIWLQRNGFHGRPHKEDDTCYTFWVGGTMKILGIIDLIDKRKMIDYVLSTQEDLVGGFSKWPDLPPDPLHTYTGISGLSLLDAFDLKPVDPALNITNTAVFNMNSLHKIWKIKAKNTKELNKKIDTLDINYKNLAIAVIIGISPVLIGKLYYLIFNQNP